MRVFQHYKFLVGTKIPYSEWPAIVEKFLKGQGLHHQQFHYYFEGYGTDTDRYASVVDGTRCRTCLAPECHCEECRENAKRILKEKSGCERAVKECPELGPVYVRKTQYDTEHYLSNLVTGGGCTKEKMLTIMNKIYRRYGFCDSYIIYQDVDFFGKCEPSEVDEHVEGPGRYKGSSITLHRQIIDTGWNSIELCVEIVYGDQILDAAVYRDAMTALLPGIRCVETRECIVGIREQQQLDELNQRAGWMLQDIHDYLEERMFVKTGNDEPRSKVSLAPILKKIGKQYGYTYVKYEYFYYYLRKRTPRGHYICLEIETGPGFNDASPCLSYQGAGFKLDTFWGDFFSPQNKRDAQEYFKTFFSVLEQAEKDVFPALDCHYPESPDWFLPEQ